MHFVSKTKNHEFAKFVARRTVGSWIEEKYINGETWYYVYSL